MNGQGLSEYAVILAVLVIVALVALLILGGELSTILRAIGAQPGLGR